MLVADFVGLGLRDGSYFNIKKPFVPMRAPGDDITFIAPAESGRGLHHLQVESAGFPGQA